jgi:hypothetical protein
MELPFLPFNYDTLTNDNYATLNQRYEYEQCYHPTEQEIKKIPLFFLLTLVFQKILPQETLKILKHSFDVLKFSSAYEIF